uniref:Homeobox-leucine zipper protein n=1 Tax=Mirabilis jalapa TaxID=3538 RepID=B8YIB0_MIRJA|nr:homeobox leucine zipper protein [Mirabilis jalapa]
MLMMQLPREHSQEVTTEADVFEHHLLSDPEEEEEEEEEDDDGNQLSAGKKKKSCKNKRRFSDEQVRSLETIFATETKLEPKKKVQVAKELGLQPRQVAIWFQNKRARWKSKQIEKNYRVLKTNYDSLKVKFETMKEEKESLLKQLQELQNLLEKSNKSENSDCKDNSAVIGAELPVKSISLQDEVDHQGIIYSDDDRSGNMAYLGHDEPELMHFNDNMDCSSIKWCNFDAGNFFDQSNTATYWWDSWI